MADETSPPSPPSWKFKICVVFLLIIFIILQFVAIGLIVKPRAPEPLKFSEKKWIIQCETGWPPYSFENDKGVITGFHVDLVNAVCEAGKLDCEVVGGPAPKCFTKQNDLGPGLQSKEYDGCAGWSNTNHRSNSGTISNAWSTLPKNGFYAKAEDAGLVVCDDSSCKLSPEAKLGLVDGWASSAACLRMNGLIDETHQPQYFTCDQIISKIQSGEINIFFIVLTDGSSNPDCLGSGFENEIQRIGQEHNCAVAGYGIGARRDSNLPTYFNKALSKLVANDGFQELCAKWNIENCCSFTADGTCM